MADKMSLSELYKFYRPLVKEAWEALKKSEAFWTKVVAMIAATVALFFNKKIAAAISAFGWEGFSRWWAVLPASILFIYYLAKANYEKFQAKDVEYAEKESALKKEIAAERERTQQPDVALIWNWQRDERESKAFRGLTEKDILIHNRSSQYIYNVRLEPVIMGQTLTFETINEIAPNSEHLALAHWGEMSSLTSSYAYFFCNNENAALENGWHRKKQHQRGLSPSFLQVPMLLTCDSHGVKWKSEFDFIYDPGGDSLFLKKSCQRAEVQ